MRTRLQSWLASTPSFGKKTWGSMSARLRWMAGRLKLIWGFVTAPLHWLAERLRLINLTDMRQVSSWVIWIAIVSLLIFLVFDLPHFMVDWGPELESFDDQPLSNLRHDYEIRHRETLLKILAGLFAVVGLIVAWHRSKAAAKQADAALQSQINERYTNAIKQLADEKIEIRLGGIYALEQIMRDSEEHHWTIVEVLSAYIRERAPWPKPQKESLVAELDIRPWKMGGFYESRADESGAQHIKPPQDIQASLSVLVRRPQDRIEPGQVDLRNVDLRGADFRGKYGEGGFLPKALLVCSNLSRAILIGANLQQASLINANLQQACLEGADLQRTRLTSANLQQAYLQDVNLQKAYLRAANLQNASLRDADLQDAFLQDANLRQTHLQFTNLQQANLTSANLQLTSFFRANLHKSNLRNANLLDSGLWYVNLRETKNLATNQLLTAQTLYGSKFQAELTHELRRLKPALFKDPNKKQSENKD